MDDPTVPTAPDGSPGSPPAAGEDPDERGSGELDRPRERLACY